MPDVQAWRVALRWLGVVLGLGVAAALLWRIGVADVAGALGAADIRLVALVVALNLPVVALRAWRTAAMLTRVGAPVPLMEVVGAQLVGQTLSGVTPAAGGDLSRAYMWRRRSGVPVATGALVVVAERVLSLVLLATVGVAALATMLGPWPLRTLAALAIALSVLPWLTARVGVLSWLLRLLTGLPLLRRRGAMLERLSRDLVGLTGDARLMTRFLLLTVAVFAVSAVQIWLLATALGASLGAPAAVAGYCLSQAGGSVSSVPFGLGAGDALLVALAAWGGVTLQAAAAVAVLFRLTTTVPIAFGATIAWARG